MSRLTRSATGVAAAVVAGLWGAALAHAATAAPIARPNPAFVGVRLDYVGPIPGVSGGAATLAPLDPAVVAQAVADQKYLGFTSADDLGGFLPALTSRFAPLGAGRNLVGRPAGTSQIPQFAQAANGQVNSFAAVGGTFTPPPDGGQGPVRGLGTPPPVTPPSNNNRVPPPNQGFGGTPPPKRPPTTTTTPTTPTRPPPTTTPTTPTTPTTTTATTPTTAAPTTPPAPPPFVGASCGTTGLTITSDHSTCEIHAVNMAPGGSASEVMTVRNDTAEPFTLSLRADGTQNSLWNDLQMGVWEAGTGAPAPLPPLLFWTSQANPLATLQPGDSIRYEIELFLPAATGNTDQGLAATIDLVWTAQG